MKVWKPQPGGKWGSRPASADQLSPSALSSHLVPSLPGTPEQGPAEDLLQGCTWVKGSATCFPSTVKEPGVQGGVKSAGWSQEC